MGDQPNWSFLMVRAGDVRFHPHHGVALIPDSLKDGKQGFFGYMSRRIHDDLLREEYQRVPKIGNSSREDRPTA